MGKSSITKPSVVGGAPRSSSSRQRRLRSLASGRGRNTEFSRMLGSLIRARRRELGLTQTQLGEPLTKGFISEVERGRSLPSLGVLVLMADRLQVPVSYLLGEVKERLPGVYTPRDENEHSPSGPGR